MEIKLSEDKKTILIEIPLETVLKYEAERPDLNYKINNLNKLLAAFLEYAQNTKIERYINNFFDKSYEDGCAWLEANWKDNPLFIKENKDAKKKGEKIESL